MIGQNIKRLRVERNMTQKELADRLYVTAQAVSRWEKGDVEPSLRTVSELAKIFGVSTDEIIGTLNEKEEEKRDQAPPKKENEKRERPQILAFCEECDRPIYEIDEMVRVHKRLYGERYTICRECHLRTQKAIQKEHEKELKKKKRKAMWARIKCLILGILLFAFFAYACINSIVRHNALSDIGNFLGGAAVWLILMYIGFSFFACIWFKNTFFGHMLFSITMFLFDFLNELLDFDDFFFMLVFGVFFLIAIAIGAIIALIVGCFVAPVLFPFALRRNLKQPERTMLTGFWMKD